jgi:hypothetical protein
MVFGLENLRRAVLILILIWFLEVCGELGGETKDEDGFISFFF